MYTDVNSAAIRSEQTFLKQTKHQRFFFDGECCFIPVSMRSCGLGAFQWTFESKNFGRFMFFFGIMFSAKAATASNACEVVHPTLPSKIFNPRPMHPF